MGPKVAPISTLGRPRGPPVIDLNFGSLWKVLAGPTWVPFWAPCWLPFRSDFGVIFRNFFGSALGATSGRLRPDLVLILAQLLLLHFGTFLETPSKSEH